MLFKPNKQLKRNKAVPYMILLCFVPVLLLYISENMMEYTFDSTREVVNISLILILAGLALITAFMNSNDKTKKLVPVFYYKNETLYFNHLSVNMMDDRNLNEKDFKKIEKVNRLIRKKGYSVMKCSVYDIYGLLKFNRINIYDIYENYEELLSIIEKLI